MFYFKAVDDIDLDSYAYQLYDISNPTSLTTPIASGRNKANVFTISVTNSTDSTPKTYYGRVAVVNSAGTVGTYTSLVSSGATPLIGEQYISSLTAAKITTGTLGAHEITLGGATSIIKSSTYNFAAPSTTPGWFIKGDGHFSLGGANGITYDNATVVIGSAVQVNANLAADSISVPVDGVTKLNINGDVGGGVGGMTVGNPAYNYWYANGNFRVGGPDNSMTWNGSSLTVVGTINATGGSFTGTISSGYNLTTQFGNNINGEVNHSGIKIGNTGWNNAWVQRNNGTIYFNTQNASGSNRIYVDSTNAEINFGSGAFIVNNAGALTANNASISGTITAYEDDTDNYGWGETTTATFSSNGTISSRLTYTGIMANYYTDTFINKKGEGGRIVVEGDASGYYQKTSIWSSTIITPTVQADTYGDHYAISGHAAVRSQRKF